MKWIMRLVVDSKDYRNPGWEKSWAVGGGTCGKLECGHTFRRKASQGTPTKIRCRECEALRDRIVSTSKEGDGPWIRTTWNPYTGMPDRRELTAEEVAELERKHR